MSYPHYARDLDFFRAYRLGGLGEAPRDISRGVAYWRREGRALAQPPSRRILRRSFQWLEARRSLLFDRAFSHSLATWRACDGWLRGQGVLDWGRFNPFEMYRPPAVMSDEVPGGAIATYPKTGNRLLLVDDLARARASFGRWSNRIRAMGNRGWCLLTITTRATSGDDIYTAIAKAREGISLVRASGLYSGWFQSMELDCGRRIVRGSRGVRVRRGSRSWRCHSHHLARLSEGVSVRGAVAWGKGLEVLTGNDVSARSCLRVRGGDGALREVSKYCFKAFGDSEALVRPWEVIGQFEAVKGVRLSETYGECRGKGIEPPAYPVKW